MITALIEAPNGPHDAPQIPIGSDRFVTPFPKRGTQVDLTGPYDIASRDVRRQPRRQLAPEGAECACGQLGGLLHQYERAE
jgi:hypothetical protein